MVFVLSSFGFVRSSLSAFTFPCSKPANGIVL